MAYDADTRDQLIEGVRRFAAERLRPIEAQVAENDAIPDEIIEEMKALGLYGLSIPEEYGGLGLSMEDECLVGFELGRTLLELALAGLHRLRARERGPLARYEPLGASGRLFLLLRRLPVVEPALQPCKLALARGDRLGSHAQRSLQLLELGARVLLLCAALLGEFPREPEQLFPVEVRAGLVWCVAAAPGRPRVEPLLPTLDVGHLTPTFSGGLCASSRIGSTSRKQAPRGYASS